MSGARLEIIVRETGGMERCGEMVTVSVPCARGAVKAGQPLSVSGPVGKEQPCQGRVLKLWPDGSVKWLLVDFAASAGAGEVAKYRLAAHEKGVPVSDQVQVLSGDDDWQVDTGKARFIVDAREFRPFKSVRIGGEELLRPGKSLCTLGLDGVPEAVALIDAVELEEAGPLRAVLRISGRFDQVPGAKARFFCRLHFFSGSSAVRIEYTLHNPGPARHGGGLWDLGDEGSLQFSSLRFSFCREGGGADIHCLPAPGILPLELPGGSRFSLYQESSGGKNWRSPVHRNRNGQVPMERCGYLAEADGKEIAAGARATPVLWEGTGGQGIALAVPTFWQEFPGEVAVADGALHFSPFPARFPEAHELQGGEQKTRLFWVDFSAKREGAARALNPLQAHAAPSLYLESGIFADLPGKDDLVDRFSGANGLFSKRESADEYGWRNFGDIHADHEAVYQADPGTFVSHYNNQYDFIAGLYRKFFATGDGGWRELAGDLSRHVRDIDLYHTDQDREEYNHGLFWHTDHHVDAGNSSHRSFSREHLKVKPAHLCGGGPGAEHCYTTGLMLHYFQTGNADFKDAVIALANWELSALAGPQTLLAAAKRGIGNLNYWRSAKGSGKLFPRYPLTRGTGNAVTACLDAFEVGGGRSFLDKSEELVRGALHPEDDIDARNLLDAEVAWSYTVLLAALAKFLDKKFEVGELDAGFSYGRAGLLAYAEWMLVNEYPYLDKPELLEYPNETWAAQDLRKSVVLYQAARYATSCRQRAAFAERARFYYDYSSRELEKHQSSRFSRPIVLILQNGWVGSRLTGAAMQPEACLGEAASSFTGASTPSITLSAVAARTATDLMAVLGRTSLARELAWLRARLSK